MQPKDQQLNRVKMVLMIDDAEYLARLNFLNAFRWVIDQVVERAYILANQTGIGEPLPFMVYFSGTNSRISDIMSSDSSLRYFGDLKRVPPPFTALNWDMMVPNNSILHYETLTYESLAEMTWLCRFGRPFWQTQWACMLIQPSKKFRGADTLVNVAENKLHHLSSREQFLSLFQNYDRNCSLAQQQSILGNRDWNERFIPTCFAIVSVLAAIKLDFFFPKLRKDLAATRLRWVKDCEQRQGYLINTYYSEPVLAEAAFRLLFAKSENKRNPDKFLKDILMVVVKEAERVPYDIRGYDDELTVRILCNAPLYFLLNSQIGVLARRQALQVTYPNVDIDSMEPSSRGDPLLYSNRLTPTTTFLSCLFKDTWIQAIKRTSPDIWQSLENGYINFSHFGKINGDDAQDGLTAQGLLNCFLHGCAIECGQHQPWYDMIIPMAVLPHFRGMYSQVSKAHISAIIFKVKKGKRDDCVFDEKFLQITKFDICNVEKFSPSKECPYIGIRICLGANERFDLCIQGDNEAFRPDGRPSCND